MTTASVDRTNEFRSALASAQKRQGVHRPGSGQRQSLLSDGQKQAANGGPVRSERQQRSEFARKAADIGRGISATMAKLERLAQLAKRKTLFDDRPVEIAELTYVIKQDLSALNGNISALQGLSKAAQSRGKSADQEGEHNKNVVVLLQGKVSIRTHHMAIPLT